MDAKKIINYLRAGFSLFWLKTYEPNRVRDVIQQEITNYQRKDGMQYKVMDWTCLQDPNPQKPLDALCQAEECSVLFLHNFHWYIDKPPVIQFIQNSIPLWQSQGKALVVVSPMEKIPAELSKDMVLLTLELPDVEEIRKALLHVTPDGMHVENAGPIVSACRGMTRSEIESTLALSLVETNGENFSIPVINDYKAQAIRKTGFLDVLEPNVRFSDVIGYEPFKRFVMETHDKPKAKGVMTIGPPGCGKTTLMKAIVAETNKFGLSVNMGKLFSKYQGETDQNVDTVIQIIKSLGECFVLIDEFEKQFAGSAGDGTLDSGTTRRATSRWLDFLQDRPSGVYICGTANSFVGIPPEYLRPGRWDSSPFFIDLPNKKTQMAILKHYCSKAGIELKKRPPIQMDQFSGAEIEAMVHIASMRGISLEEAERCVIATAKTSASIVNQLRDWAKENTVPADDIPGMEKNGKRKIDV